MSDTTKIILIALAVIVLLAVIALVVRMRGQRKKEEQRAEAERLRQEAAVKQQELAAREREAEAQAQEAERRRREAEEAAAAARAAEQQAAAAQQGAHEIRTDVAEQQRQADLIDPDVATDKHGNRLEDTADSSPVDEPVPAGAEPTGAYGDHAALPVEPGSTPPVTHTVDDTTDAQHAAQHDAAPAVDAADAHLPADSRPAQEDPAWWQGDAEQDGRAAASAAETAAAPAPSAAASHEQVNDPDVQRVDHAAAPDAPLSTEPLGHDADHGLHHHHPEGVADHAPDDGLDRGLAHEHGHEDGHNHGLHHHHVGAGDELHPDAAGRHQATAAVLPDGEARPADAGGWHTDASGDAAAPREVDPHATDQGPEQEHGQGSSINQLPTEPAAERLAEPTAEPTVAPMTETGSTPTEPTLESEVGPTVDSRVEPDAQEHHGSIGDRIRSLRDDLRRKD